MKFDHFEDMMVWQKSQELTLLIYKTFQSIKDFGFRDQIQRAAVSISNNIAEGFDAGTNPEFIRFLKISRRSASEVQSELYLALDRNYISQDELTKAYDLATETKRLINGMIGYLRKS